MTKRNTIIITSSAIVLGLFGGLAMSTFEQGAQAEEAAPAQSQTAPQQSTDQACVNMGSGCSTQGQVIVPAPTATPEPAPLQTTNQTTQAAPVKGTCSE